jgi:hypothetical protein
VIKLYVFQYSDIQIKALLFLYDYMSNMTGYLIRDRNCYLFAVTLVHPRFFVGVRVAHLFSYLCCVLVLFAFAVCLVLHITCVSGLFVLDCPFRISTRFIYYRVLVTGRVVNVVGLSPWRYLQTQTYAWPVLPYWVSLSRFSWGFAESDRKQQ